MHTPRHAHRSAVQRRIDARLDSARHHGLLPAPDPHEPRHATPCGPAQVVTAA